MAIQPLYSGLQRTIWWEKKIHSDIICNVIAYSIITHENKRKPSGSRLNGKEMWDVHLIMHDAINIVSEWGW